MKEFPETFISEKHEISIVVDGRLSPDDQHRVVDWHLLTLAIPSNVKPQTYQVSDRAWYKWKWETTQRISESSYEINAEKDDDDA